MRNMLRKVTVALALMGNAALLAIPSFAVEPDIDSPAGPELSAPRTDRPDFPGALLNSEAEGADPTPPPRVDIVDPTPDVVAVPDD
jgi:hypothetical protein